jgi:GH25 family lysozyme M1 (1,4-beta-N-acetylmuramidase)
MSNQVRFHSCAFVVFVVAGCGPRGVTVGETSAGYTFRCSDDGSVVYGVDVSSYQGGSIDWGAVKASGRAFGFAKATEGTGYQDATFNHNWAGMKSAGMVRGAYHFFHPSIDGTAQADYFVDWVNANGGFVSGDLPMIDLEVTDGVAPAGVVSATSAFLNEVRARTGLPVVFYTGLSFFQDTLGNPNFSSYPLFIADYDGQNCPYIPTSWPDWKFWQYDDNDSVPGIPGNVDGDLFNGTLADLQALGGGPPPAIPPLPTGCGNIQVGYGLHQGTELLSCDGRFALAMQTDGNLVLYSYGVPMWATGSNGRGDVAVMQRDGDFVLYDFHSVALFTTATSGNAGAFLALQNDGNLVIYDNNKPLWASNTDGIPPAPLGCGAIQVGHGLGPGEGVKSCDGRFNFVMQGDGNLVLYQGTSPLWASNTVGKGGRTAVMQADGNFVVYALGNAPRWASNTNGNPGASLVVQNDGNVVIYDSGKPIWASNTCCR